MISLDKELRDFINGYQAAPMTYLCNKKSQDLTKILERFHNYSQLSMLSDSQQNQIEAIIIVLQTTLKYTEERLETKKKYEKIKKQLKQQSAQTEKLYWKLLSPFIPSMHSAPELIWTTIKQIQKRQKELGLQDDEQLKQPQREKTQNNLSFSQKNTESLLSSRSYQQSQILKRNQKISIFKNFFVPYEKQKDV